MSAARPEGARATAQPGSRRTDLRRRSNADCGNAADSAGEVPHEPSPCISAANPFLFPVDLLEIAAGATSQVPCRSASAGRRRPDESIDGMLASDPLPRWWLAHVKPRQEKRLAGELRILKIAHYLPATPSTAYARGRSYTTLQPLFSGYLFLWGQPEERLTALRTRRIVTTRVVGDEDGLAIRLRELADLIQQGVPLRVEERLVPGQLVRVKAGPLKGKRGTILRRCGQVRLLLHVSKLLGGVSLEIDQFLLEPY